MLGVQGSLRQEAKFLLSEANAAYVMWLAFQAAIDHRALLDVRDGEVVFIHPKRLATHRVGHGCAHHPSDKGERLRRFLWP